MKTSKNNARKSVKGKTKAAVTRLPRVAYADTQKITVLTKDNPRREGSGPHERLETLMKSKTVGAFLKQLPKWRSTITRAVKDGIVRVS